MPTYQSVPDERIDEYRSVLQYAFRPAEAPETYESIDELPGPARVGARRGLFDGDDLLCTCAHHWFTVRLRDGEHPLAGLSAVATPPENRRQGLIERLLYESLAEYRERDQYLSALWPFEYPFYRKYGWAQAGTYASYEFDPDALAFATKADDGEFRRLDADEFERLNTVLDAHNDGVSLSMRRTEEWWRRRIFEGWERDPYVYGYERDGELRGYLVYTVEADDETTMRVYELVPTDHEAYTNLLRFCHYHDSQVENVRLHGRPDTLLFDLVDDPRAIEYEVTPGGMVRIVDVEAALSALDYPAECEGRIVVSVRDSLADWNDTTFAIEVAEGEATCRPVDERPDVTISIQTLSQLVVGHFSVERATFTGTLSIESEHARELLEGMFPSREVFLREGF